MRESNRASRQANLDARAALTERARVLGSGYGTGERLRLKAAVDALHAEGAIEAKRLLGEIKRRCEPPASASARRSAPPAV